MKIVNHTDFDNELVRQIIRFVRPPGISNFKVTLFNSDPDQWDCWRGRADSTGMALLSALRSGGKTLGAKSWIKIKSSVKIYVPRGAGHVARFTIPRRWLCLDGDGSLPGVMFSPEEALVHLLAHELRHVWQARVPRGRRVWGARGQFSERDADAYAIRRLRAWRRNRMNCTRSATRRDLSMNVAT